MGRLNAINRDEEQELERKEKEREKQAFKDGMIYFWNTIENLMNMSIG